MTSQSPAHVALENEDAPAVEGQDNVLPPSRKSLFTPCSISASETSYLRGWSRTSFLRGLRLVDPEGRGTAGASRPLLAPGRSF